MSLKLIGSKIALEVFAVRDRHLQLESKDLRNHLLLGIEIDELRRDRVVGARDLALMIGSPDTAPFSSNALFTVQLRNCQK